MTPSAILSRAESLGLTITPDGENLRIRGPRDAIEEITPLLKMHKPAILAAIYLSTNDAIPSLSRLQTDGLGKGGQQRTSTPQSPSVFDLDYLIKAAATFYEYSPDDLVVIDEMKRDNPDGLRLALGTDPLRPFYTHNEPT
jgi:hypothetical protein